MNCRFWGGFYAAIFSPFEARAMTLAFAFGSDSLLVELACWFSKANTLTGFHTFA